MRVGVHEREPRQRSSHLHERNAAADNDGADDQLHDVYLLRRQKTPEQTATTKEPDLPASTGAQSATVVLGSSLTIVTVGCCLGTSVRENT
jgi:hypothetical protein